MTVNAAMDERLDPVASAQGAARYLRYAHNLLGSWPLTVTSYNHGIGGMQRAKDYHGADIVRIINDYDHRLFGFASRNFYTEFLAARDVASQPQRFFPEGLRYDPPLNWERITLKQTMPVSDIARYYGVDRSQLIALNSAWTEAAHADRAPIPAEHRSGCRRVHSIEVSPSNKREKPVWIGVTVKIPVGRVRWHPSTKPGRVGMAHIFLSTPTERGHAHPTRLTQLLSVYLKPTPLYRMRSSYRWTSSCIYACLLKSWRSAHQEVQK